MRLLFALFLLTSTLFSQVNENFEAASKRSYAVADIETESGIWEFDNALVGTLQNDRKRGSKSARIRGTGHIEMQFDVLNISEFSFQYASYGLDQSSVFQVYVSYDDGETWDALGQLTHTENRLQTVKYFVASGVPARFRISNVSNGSRINIDEIIFKRYSNTQNFRDSNVALGIPTRFSTTDQDNYYIHRRTYDLSYNSSKGIPNWVSWHLNSAWLGTQPRANRFLPDNTLPECFTVVKHSDYTNSGFDRGHVTPSADRNFNYSENLETYIMTNIIPQAPRNNRVVWVNFENYLRRLVKAGNEIYIVAGSYGQCGDGSKGEACRIKDKLTVPSNIWKSVIIIPNGGNDLNRINSQTKTITIDVPNSQSVSNDWWSYTTSIDEIETKTGFDLFSAIPDSIENYLETLIYTE